MTDLATALQQVLRQVREETEHNERCKIYCDECNEFALHLDPTEHQETHTMMEAITRDCSCDFEERVEAEQARRWAAFADKLWSWNSQYMHCESQEEEKQVDIDAFASALKAAQQERGSDEPVHGLGASGGDLTP